MQSTPIRERDLMKRVITACAIAVLAAAAAPAMASPVQTPAATVRNADGLDLAVVLSD